MSFDGNYSLREWRRRDSKHRRKHSSQATSCVQILAYWLVCASVAAAHASPIARADECKCGTLMAVDDHPAPSAYKRLFDYRSDSPILNFRASARSLNDITGAIPDLRFGPVSPKPVSPTLVTSLTPPETIETTVDETDEALAAPMIVGIASTYNPFNPADKDAGGLQTASGELYDVNGWTAAIRLDLRERFGGVRYGRNYRPTYAMVEAGAKRVIVKINDVGPLKPGRIIDLNERTMRFFDPSLQLGLLNGVRVTPLEGTNWISGPVGGDDTIRLAGSFVRQ